MVQRRVERADMVCVLLAAELRQVREVNARHTLRHHAHAGLPLLLLHSPLQGALDGRVLRRMGTVVVAWGS